MNRPLTDILGPAIANDALGMLIGEALGEGAHRKVYACQVLPRCVVKIETAAQQFFNVLEWEMWCEMETTRWAKWLAPCRFISDCGAVLIQDRCELLETRPARVPGFLWDLKRENWGDLRGKPVCFDYGNNPVIRQAARRSRLVRPKWFDLGKRKVR